MQSATTHQLVASNVTKRYRIGPPLSAIFPRFIKSSSVTALKDINFSVSRGERVGIIGRNGSGKSTLLKLLCGCSSPSAGTIEVNGRISAIIELGTGFSPGSSVMDNAKMGLICQGVDSRDLDCLIEQVLTFSELRDYVNRQFSTLSSGMQARLMISAALVQTPEVLIVDEALATGDALFQAKCLERVREICDLGATVIFVTHSLSLLYQFCTRGILLHKGAMIGDGPPEAIGRLYERLLAQESAKANEQDSEINSGCASRQHSSVIDLSSPTTGEASSVAKDGASPHQEKLVLRRESDCSLGDESSELPADSTVLKAPPIISLLSNNDTEANTINYGQKYEIEFSFELTRDCSYLDIGYRFCTPTGMPVTGDTLRCHGLLAFAREGQHILRFSFISQFATGEFILDYGIVQVEPGALRFNQICFERMDSLVTAYSDVLINGLIANPSASFSVYK